MSETRSQHCQSCSRRFASRNELFAHLRQFNHWGNEIGSTVTCDQTSQTPPLTSPKPSKYTCPKCPRRVFVSLDMLKDHFMKSNHGLTEHEAIPLQPNQCLTCSKSFPSRNKLFAHLHKTVHLQEAPQGLEKQQPQIVDDVEVIGNPLACLKLENRNSPVPTYTPSASETDYGELEDFDDEFEIDIDPPDELAAWNPFSDIQVLVLPETLNQHRQELVAAKDWDAKCDIVINKLLKPYLDMHEDQFSGWPQQELRKIFAEVKELPKLPVDEKRYVCNEYHPRAGHIDDDYCIHAEQCWCWFEATPEAGISGLLVAGPRMRKDRKACIQFMHNLVVQCLLILMEPLYHCLDDDDAKWDVYRAVMWMNPNSEEREVYPFDDEDEDEREAYLNNDYTFVQIASQEFKISQSNDTSPGLITADIQKLCGTLGRRAITLSICRSGDGSVFARKNPINYWNISEFIKDSQATKIASSSEKATEDYLKQNPRSTVERPRYPTRVINTHTLHFEDDQIMFQKDYAVLSHTWSQKAREVTYEDAATALMEIKEKYIMTKILGLQKKMKPTLPERRRARDQSKPDSEIRELQAELDELKMARLKRDNATRSQEQGSTAPTGGSAVDTSKDLEIRDPGKAKLAKALSEARKLGFTYLWVDNVCINKPNNTELVEAISSMGDWYQNSQVCLVYIDDFSGEDISDKNVDMAAKNRYATRGWTLQEIVMCPRAVFYNKSWKKIADTKPNDKDEDEDHQRLLQLLARVCHVPPNLLCAHGKPNVAASRILQLASKRRTFKPEDRAYSLMGMLGIRMRADYGEGQEKAVSRLFESVIHTTADVSVFNWTGKFAASTVVGRSMYPSDFNSYDLVTTLENEFKNTTEDDICNSDQSSEVRRQYDISEWLLNDSEKPAQALGSIMLDYFGVYARFDICEMDIVIEGDNSETLKKLNQLHDKVQNSATSDHVPITDCSCKCTFTFRNGFVANVEVFCPISSLRSILNYLVEPDRSDNLKSRFDDSTSMWVMARFAGVHNSSWFLCEIKQNIQIASYGLFSNVLQSQDVNRFDGSALFGMYTKKKSGTKRNRDANTKMRMPGTLSFMDYLENSGFPAQRLSTTCLPQKGIPNSKELLKNAYMWIG